MTVTESQFAPGVAASAEGDIWIRLTAGGHRQRYQLMEDKLEGQNATLAWVGFPPQSGAVGLHLAKLSAQQYHSQWVGAQHGLAVAISVPNPAATWTISHSLAYRLVDITCIRALDDWTYDPGTQAWTDPQAGARPATIMVPRLVLATLNATQLQFVEPVRGIALVRR